MHHEGMTPGEMGIWLPVREPSFQSFECKKPLKISEPGNDMHKSFLNLPHNKFEGNSTTSLT